MNLTREGLQMFLADFKNCDEFFDPRTPANSSKPEGQIGVEQTADSSQIFASECFCAEDYFCVVCNSASAMST